MANVLHRSRMLAIPREEEFHTMLSLGVFEGSISATTVRFPREGWNEYFRFGQIVYFAKLGAAPKRTFV